MKLVLLVEDDDQRAAEIQACIPDQIRCVHARSAGAALGVLHRDKVDGVLLDFDLDRAAHGNTQFTGEAVAGAICETQDRQCQIFVHSQNSIGGWRVFDMLKQAGFSVERCPWSTHAIEPLRSWLGELLD